MATFTIFHDHDATLQSSQSAAFRRGVHQFDVVSDHSDQRQAWPSLWSLPGQTST